MHPIVLVPTAGYATRRVNLDEVHSIICHREKHGVSIEQYLVRWETDSPTRKPPLSWHSVDELWRCLEHVQDYLFARAKSPNLVLSKKRKSPDTVTTFERRSSPIDHNLYQNGRGSSTERSPSVASASKKTIHMPPASTLESANVYNGVLEVENGVIFARPAFLPDTVILDIQDVPTAEMMQTTQRASTQAAEVAIRAEYTRRLERLPGEKVYLTNIRDMSTPSLRFKFITDYILGEGVYRASLDTQVGCHKCSPHMGRDIGCEYTRKCDCLEYAAVDESRLTAATKTAYDIAKVEGSSTMGFPKKFPYFAEGTKKERTGCLVPFYLNSRRPIYECNNNCRCGPRCRNKNVQFGRKVELEIFKTSQGRGWGLRCRQRLYEGQFIDTYRGEIITDAEATRRESSGNKSKASYLYSLDKFAESEGLSQEEIYVVDGELMGGPTKFMNHSCQPNCRQYTVSYNKHDCKVYDLAFFACRDIEKGEELTFDYLDKEEGEEMDDPGEDAVPCLCGAEKCRKWLWT